MHTPYRQERPRPHNSHWPPRAPHRLTVKDAWDECYVAYASGVRPNEIFKGERYVAYASDVRYVSYGSGIRPDKISKETIVRAGVGSREGPRYLAPLQGGTGRFGGRRGPHQMA